MVARPSLCISQLADRFRICDSPICSLLFSLKLAIHAVWQRKTGWLSSNSLQTDSPASGCHAKTERSGTEIETVIRGIPILSLSSPTLRQCCDCGFTTTGTWANKSTLGCQCNKESSHFFRHHLQPHSRNLVVSWKVGSRDRLWTEQEACKKSQQPKLRMLPLHGGLLYHVTHRYAPDLANLTQF